MQSRSSTLALAAVLLACLSSSSSSDALLFGPATLPAHSVAAAAAAAVSHVAEAPAREALVPDFGQVRSFFEYTLYTT
jgi:hypothetical protein